MSSNFLSNFTTRYLDPTELYGRFRELADEFPDLTTIIPLPYKTNGYQRRAQALMAGLTIRQPRGTSARPSGPRPSSSRRARGATRAATTSRPSSSIPALRTRRSP